MEVYINARGRSGLARRASSVPSPLSPSPDFPDTLFNVVAQFRPGMLRASDTADSPPLVAGQSDIFLHQKWCVGRRKRSHLILQAKKPVLACLSPSLLLLPPGRSSLFAVLVSHTRRYFSRFLGRSPLACGTALSGKRVHIASHCDARRQERKPTAYQAMRFAARRGLTRVNRHIKRQRTCLTLAIRVASQRRSPSCSPVARR